MAFLVRRGWTIEAHRFRVGHSDLDIVARRGGLVIFAEVKTRGSAGYGAPAESVGWRKQNTVARLAQVWTERHGRAGDEYRFDVLEVRVMGDRRYQVEQIADAWRLG